jgi:hypothetical protein
MDSINEDFIDNIVTNLKIISLIKVDEKLSIRKGHLSLDNSSNFQFLKRWFYRDSRDITLLFIKDLVRSISILFDKINCYNDNINIIKKVLVEMENAKSGLINLKSTYSDDPVMVVKFENVSTKFCEMVDYGKRKYEQLII